MTTDTILGTISGVVGNITNTTKVAKAVGAVVDYGLIPAISIATNVGTEEKDIDFWQKGMFTELAPTLAWELLKAYVKQGLYFP